MTEILFLKDIQELKGNDRLKDEILKLVADGKLKTATGMQWMNKKEK